MLWIGSFEKTKNTCLPNCVHVLRNDQKANWMNEKPFKACLFAFTDGNWPRRRPQTLRQYFLVLDTKNEEQEWKNGPSRMMICLEALLPHIYIIHSGACIASGRTERWFLHTICSNLPKIVPECYVCLCALASNRAQKKCESKSGMKCMSNAQAAGLAYLTHSFVFMPVFVCAVSWNELTTNVLFLFLVAVGKIHFGTDVPSYWSQKQVNVLQ